MAAGSLAFLAFAAQLAGAGVLVFSRPGAAGRERVYAGAALFFAGCATLFTLAVAERNFLLALAECAALTILALMLRREPDRASGSGRRAERGRAGPESAKRGVARGSEQKH